MDKKRELIDSHKFVCEHGKLQIDGKIISIKDYTILEKINNGANAIILRAQGNIDKNVVAIKVWVPDTKADRREQSINEIVKMSEINKSDYSPNLIRYFGSGISNGYYYCIMEYLDMKEYITLREKQNQQMLLHERYQILMKIVSGLRVVQESMIFHGDLHADNILVNRNSGDVKIIDFGTSFRNKEYSRKRDNRMTLELAKSLLGEELDSQLILFYDKNYENLPQNAIRLLVKAVSKVVVLLDFWKYGNVDTIVEDIAVFITLVPFFNLKYIVHVLFEIREVPEYYRKVFKEKIITELFSNTSDIEFDQLEEMYAENQHRFISLCERESRENFIYRNYHQAEVFNGPLYSKYFSQDEDIVERMEIESVIE